MTKYAMRPMMELRPRGGNQYKNDTAMTLHCHSQEEEPRKETPTR